MPVQTTKTGYMSFPDGGKVSVKTSGGSWYDVGALNSAVNFTLNFTENQVTTANAATTDKQIRDMLIDGSFTLVNLEPDAIQKMGGGMFEVVQTTGTTVNDADITDQTIDGFTEGTPVDLRPIITADDELLRFSATPSITSVSASSAGSLTENDDYFIIKDSTSPSGYSISFITTGTATVGTDETITVDFGDNDPVAGETIYAGSTTELLSAYGLKIEHTDDNAEIDRSFEIYSTNPSSGGFQFNFKGANEEGLNEMPLTFQGDLDTSRASGRQLFSYYTKS